MTVDTRVVSTNDANPQLNKEAAANLRTVINAIRDDVASLLSGTHLVTTAGLAIGSSSAAKVLTAAFQYQVDGVRAHKASAETAFTATTHDIADPDDDPREAIYVLSIAQGGTITITKGTTAAADAAVAPATPAGELKLGEVLIQHDGTAIFDASSNDLDADHLTVTYTSEDVFAQTSFDLTDD